MSRDRSGEIPLSEPVKVAKLLWCSDLIFPNFLNDTSLPVGYAGKCVGVWSSGYDEVLSEGAQLPYLFDGSNTFAFSYSISSVFVEQLNIFEGEFHKNNDDVTVRYWDDGRPKNPSISWEPRDEGDKGEHSASSSWSAVGYQSWMSSESAAQILNMPVAELTPDAFQEVYANVWIDLAAAEAANDNPYPEDALEIIEEVEEDVEAAGIEVEEGDEHAIDATKIMDATTNAIDAIIDAATNDGLGADANAGATGGGDDAAAAEDPSPGNRRKLTSVTTRVVMAALRMFGI